MERNALKVIRPEKQGIKVHDILTRLEYKEDNKTFLERKVHLYAKEDQQWEVKVLLHLIHMHLLSRRQKRNSWQSSQQNMVARF